MPAKNPQPPRASRRPESSLGDHRRKPAPTGLCPHRVSLACQRKNHSRHRGHPGFPRHRYYHRRQAGSYRVMPPLSGAGLPAKKPQPPRASRLPPSSLTTIAGKAAPTGLCPHGRSWLASEKPTAAAGIQAPASSLTTLAGEPAPTGLCPTVGAGLPAKKPQPPRASRRPAPSLTTIAGKPAPTGLCPHGGSWLASEKPTATAGIQASRVIVDDHRRQAGSYRTLRSKIAPSMPSTSQVSA